MTASRPELFSRKQSGHIAASGARGAPDGAPDHVNPDAAFFSGCKRVPGSRPLHGKFKGAQTARHMPPLEKYRHEKTPAESAELTLRVRVPVANWRAWGNRSWP